MSNPLELISSEITNFCIIGKRSEFRSILVFPLAVIPIAIRRKFSVEKWVKGLNGTKGCIAFSASLLVFTTDVVQMPDQHP